MRKVINDHLVRVIADLAIFLEFTNEDFLDPDTSLEAMEKMAMELQLMEDEDRNSLANQLKSLSLEYKDERKVKFINALPEALGLE